MVAGHAISRPRIQLERMDPSLIQTAAQDEQIPEQEEPVHEEEMSTTPPVPPPSRNVFDLTNIREESYMEDSMVMEETIISPSAHMEAVQEEIQEDMDHEEASTSTRSSLGNLRLVTSTARRSGISRACLQPPPQPVLSQSPASFSPDIVSTQADPSPSIPDTSPYVLESETTPVGLPRPQPRAGEPSARRTTDPNHSASLTESFLEQVMGLEDPMEGPSWLFASVKKKKRRTSAVKKLSCIMSDLDNSEEELDLSLDSNLGDQQGEFVLDKDLRQSQLPSQEDDNQENVPLDDGDEVRLSNEPRNQVTVTPRTPLSSLRTCLDDGGNQVSLKEARVMLNNVSNVSLEGTASGEDSPFLTNRKKTMTLDELFMSSKTKDDYDESLTCVGAKRKFGSEPRMGEATKPSKKPRTTELPSTTSASFNLVQNVEVRLEKNLGLSNDENSLIQGNRTSTESQAGSETEGRSSRRAKTKVSYKEPALGKKLRQVRS